MTQARIPLEKNGGTIYYEVHKEGKPDSQRYAVEYGDPMELPADLTGLQELIAKCEAVNEADCTSATWTVFAEKLAAAKAIAEGTARAAATAAQAELALGSASCRPMQACATRATPSAWLKLRARFEPMYQEADYTKASFAAYKSALDAAKAAMEADDSSNYEYEQLRIALEAGVRGLVVFCLRNQRSNGEPRNGSGCPGQNPAVHRPGDRHR